MNDFQHLTEQEKIELALQLLSSVPSSSLPANIQQYPLFSKDYLSSLPYELLVHIFSYVDYKTLVSKLSRVSKTFKNISLDNNLWREHYKVEFIGMNSNKKQQMKSGSKDWVQESCLNLKFLDSILDIQNRLGQVNYVAVPSKIFEEHQIASRGDGMLYNRSFSTRQLQLQYQQPPQFSTPTLDRDGITTGSLPRGEQPPANHPPTIQIPAPTTANSSTSAALQSAYSNSMIYQFDDEELNDTLPPLAASLSSLKLQQPRQRAVSNSAFPPAPSKIIVPSNPTRFSVSTSETYNGRYDSFNWIYIFQQRLLLHRNWLSLNYLARDFQGHTDAIYCLQFDEEKIISGSRDNTIKVWDMKSKKILHSLTGHDGSILCLQYSHTHLISGSSDKSMIMWSLPEFTPIRKIVAHAESVLNLKFDDRFIISCSRDKSVKVWDFNSGALVYTLSGHRAAVNAVQFQGDLIVSASGDRTIKVWSLKTGDLIRTLTGHSRGIACIAFEKEIIISGSSDETIKLWNVHTGELLNTLYGHTDLVRTVQFDNKFIVSGSYDSTLKIWDMKTGELIHDIKGGNGKIFKVEFNPMKIVCCSAGGEIVVYDFSDSVDIRFFV